MMIKHPNRTVSFLLSLLVSVIYRTLSREVGICPVGSDTVGANCHAQGEHWQHDGVCLANEQNTKRCHVPDTRTFEFNLRVGIRQGLLAQGGVIKSIYVAGAGPGLDWTQPKKLQKTASGVGFWILNINTHMILNPFCAQIPHTAHSINGDWNFEYIKMIPAHRTWLAPIYM